MRIRCLGVLLALAASVAFAQVVEDCFTRDPGPLDFIRGEGYEQSILQALTGDALVGVDSSGNPVPRLASAWTAGRDGSLRFTLRGDARFTDGTPVSAEDVRWTFEAIQSDPGASPTKRAILQGLSVQVVKGQVLVRSPKPADRLLLELPRVPIARRGQPDCGSGPFQLRREQGAWRLERREHFLNPRISGLRFRLLGDSQAQYQALQKGWLSLGQPPARLQAQPPSGYRVLVNPGLNQLVVWSRLGTPSLQALERWRKDAFPPHLLGPSGRPSAGLWPASLGFQPAAIAAPPAPLPKDRPLRLIYAAEDGPTEKLLLALRERARREGVQLDLLPLTEATVIDRLQKGQFELACFVATYDPEPWSVLEYMEPDGPMNFTGWRHPGLAPLVARLTSRSGPAWRDLQGLWAAAPGALPLVDFQTVLWVDRRLKVTPSPVGIYLCTPGAAGWRWGS